MKILIVVDMQNDFITGSLGSKMAEAIVPNVVNKIKNFDGVVIATQDTHYEDYLSTQEGKNLPVPHCIYKTKGWEIEPTISELIKTKPIIKNTFGSSKLVEILKQYENIESITFVGLCTDICVISNAILVKAFYPEIPLYVDKKCCAGVSEKSHENALNAMSSMQITIL